MAVHQVCAEVLDEFRLIERIKSGDRPVDRQAGRKGGKQEAIGGDWADGNPFAENFGAVSSDAAVAISENRTGGLEEIGGNPFAPLPEAGYSARHGLGPAAADVWTSSVSGDALRGGPRLHARASASAHISGLREGLQVMRDE